MFLTVLCCEDCQDAIAQANWVSSDGQGDLQPFDTFDYLDEDSGFKENYRHYT